MALPSDEGERQLYNVFLKDAQQPCLSDEQSWPKDVVKHFLWWQSGHHGKEPRVNWLAASKPEQPLATGSRVSVVRGAKNQRGTIRFQGKVNFGEGFFYGVELDEEDGLANNGTVKKKRYFKCDAKRGIFARPEQLARLVDEYGLFGASPAPSTRPIPSPTTHDIPGGTTEEGNSRTWVGGGGRSRTNSLSTSRLPASDVPPARSQPQPSFMAQSSIPTTVTVFSLRGALHKPSVYIKVKLGKKKLKTHCLSPLAVDTADGAKQNQYKFNTAFTFPSWPPSEQLNISVWEKRVVGKSAFIGEVYIKRTEDEVQRVYTMLAKKHAAEKISLGVKLYAGPETDAALLADRPVNPNWKYKLKHALPPPASKPRPSRHGRTKSTLLGWSLGSRGTEGDSPSVVEEEELDTTTQPPEEDATEEEDRLAIMRARTANRHVGSPIPGPPEDEEADSDDEEEPPPPPLSDFEHSHDEEVNDHQDDFEDATVPPPPPGSPVGNMLEFQVFQAKQELARLQSQLEIREENHAGQKILWAQQEKAWGGHLSRAVKKYQEEAEALETKRESAKKVKAKVKDTAGEQQELIVVVTENGKTRDTNAMVGTTSTLADVHQYLMSKLLLPVRHVFTHHKAAIDPKLYPMVLASLLLPVLTVTQREPTEEELAAEASQQAREARVYKKHATSIEPEPEAKKPLVTHAFSRPTIKRVKSVSAESVPIPSPAVAKPAPISPTSAAKASQDFSTRALHLWKGKHSDKIQTEANPEDPPALVFDNGAD